MKKFLKVLLLVVCMFAMTLPSHAAQKYYIRSVSDLKKVMEHPDGTFYLTKNLNLRVRNGRPSEPRSSPLPEHSTVKDIRSKI